MSAAIGTLRGPLVTGRRKERSVGALAFHLVLLLSLLVALLTLITLLVTIVRDGAGHLSVPFLTNLDSRLPSRAGIQPALVGTLWLMGLVAVISAPVGIGAAIYLEEFAPENRMTAFIEVNLANLAAVPSIVYGLLGLAAFVQFMALGETLLAGALTLVLLILPIIIVASREALRAVPASIKQGALAVGATPWQAVSRQTLPAALPGIMTGTILGLSRAIGETAPLIVIGAAGFITSNPDSLTSFFTALPIQIFTWFSSPNQELRELVPAGILVLLVLLLVINSIAIYFRNRFESKW